MFNPDFELENVFNFQDRTIIVTGGARGIGAATCHLLARLGARIAFTYYRAEKEAEQLAETLNTMTRVYYDRLDVRQSEDARKFIETFYRSFGPIHGLVNNASYANPDVWNRSLESIPIEAIRQTLETDVLGSWIMCQAVREKMEPGRSAIVNIASAAALYGDKETAAYSPAKMGIVGLTRSLARMLAPDIRVNAVAPGSVQTHWITDWNLSDDDIRELSNSIPLKRLIQPEEIAWTIVFLLSPATAGVTGQTWVVDGGMIFH